LKIEIKNYSIKLERATGIEPVLPTWESKLSTLYFQHLQNRSAKIYVHALHTVHALPDLRVAAGRLRDGVSAKLMRSLSRHSDSARHAFITRRALRAAT
jgi:hypothetical protein